MSSKIYKYLVTYEHSHVHYNSKHSTTIEAHNAKEACDEVLRRYHAKLDELYEKRHTIKGASRYGVYYPFHRHATKIKEEA